MAPQLAWLGLGNMGRGMCKNLVEKGNLSNPLIIYNRTTKKAEELASKLGHATVATSIGDAVSKADIIFFCLGDDNAVQETMEEALKQDVKGKLFVDCSTIHPDTTSEEEKSYEAAGAEFVACPVFGAPAMADSGQLVCVIAGKSSAAEKMKPYCKGVMGRENIEFLDQNPQKALQLKIIGNTFIMGMVETLSEGHVVSEKVGLGVDNLHKFISTMFPGPFAAYSTRMISGDYYKRQEPLFAVDLARKDIRHAQALAKTGGAEFNHLKISDDLLQGVKEHVGAKGDIAAMYGAKRTESGLPFENGA